MKIGSMLDEAGKAGKKVGKQFRKNRPRDGGDDFAEWFWGVKPQKKRKKKGYD